MSRRKKSEGRREEKRVKKEKSSRAVKGACDLQLWSYIQIYQDYYDDDDDDYRGSIG